MASIESAISERIPPLLGNIQRPQWWTSALTLGHLESKLHAARVLDSSTEYKQTLLLYAKKIADEGFRNKAEELIKELFGPIYWSVFFACKKQPFIEDSGDLVCSRRISGIQCFLGIGREIFLKKSCKYLVSTSNVSQSPDMIEFAPSSQQNPSQAWDGLARTA
jgi:TUP1-like enhancer of split